jgi:sec-independent protein translocase protein TatA
MSSIGLPEMLVIGLVIVLLFGTRKIPEVAKGLGESVRHFKSAMKGQADDLKEIKNEVEKV